MPRKLVHNFAFFPATIFAADSGGQQCSLHGLDVPLQLSFWFFQLQIAIALLIASEALGPYDVTLARYFPTAKSSGQIIDKSQYAVILSVALGILAEIRFVLRDKSKQPLG